MWLYHLEFENLVQTTWQEKVLVDDFGEKIQQYGQILMDWDTHVFGHIRRNIKELRKNLDSLQKIYQSDIMMEEAHNVEDKLNHFLKLEETMWHQRSRALWLKDGDKNSSFFHKKAAQRKKRNCISRIMNDDGVWVTNAEILRGSSLSIYRRFLRQMEAMRLTWW